MKRISFALLFCLATVIGWAQTAGESKPDCKPKSCSIKDKKACGPKNTKVGEAAAITSLRMDVLALKTKLGAESEVKVGATDEESLEILISEMQFIMSQNKTELPDLGSTNAQKVANLRKLIEEIGIK